MKALSLATFKQRYSLTQKEVNELVSLGIVALQQNGYRGDSPNHHKLIVFPEDFQHRTATAYRNAEETEREIVNQANKAVIELLSKASRKTRNAEEYLHYVKVFTSSIEKGLSPYRAVVALHTHAKEQRVLNRWS